MKKVYYLGPEDSYSGIVAKKVYGSSEYELLPCPSFDDIVKNTIADPRSIGVLPIENSSTSTIHVNVDFLFQEKLGIVGEANMPIILNLIGLEDSSLKDIKSVFSHPKALGQCTNFIRENNFYEIETSSTADGATKILELNDKANAAIGSSEIAKRDGLKILQENIGNYKKNTTRFIFVSNNEEEIQKASDDYKKVTVIFRTPHKAGSLANLLTSIGGIGVNLTKIESRPIPDTDWEYSFWMDMELDQSQETALETIFKKCTSSYKIIGNYKNLLK